MAARRAHCIWVISKYLSSRAYGFETRSVAIARHWAAEGRRPVVIASDSNHLATFPRLAEPVIDEEEDGVWFRWLRVRRYDRSASATRVLSWIDFEFRLFRSTLSALPRPDVIIVSSLSLLTVLNGIRLARRFRVPWVFEVRDIWPLTLVAEGGFSPLHPLSLLLAWIERIGYRRADAVVGTMPNLSPHASAVARKPIAATCIPFGFDPLLSAAATAETRDGPQISRVPGQLVIGYAGSIGITNALGPLVDCAVALKDDDRFKFVLLGEGQLREQYMHRTADCPHVEWIGRVPRHEVLRYLRQCDVLYFGALPSKVWAYGMSPNKLIDYMLSGRPVVASYDGFQSMLNEANCGVFVPSGDVAALAAALERFRTMSGNERDEMGARGEAWLHAHRTWAHIAGEYGRLLDSLVERKRQ